MVAHGWTLLPGQCGALAHRTDPDRDGYVLCGRPADPLAGVHEQNPGFDPCAECTVQTGEPVRTGFRPPVSREPDTAAVGRPRGSRPVPAQRRSPATMSPGEADGGELQQGWVRLPGRLLHRPDPVVRQRVACGKELPIGVQVHSRPPADWQACPTCEATLPARMASARKRGLLDTARQEKIARRAAANTRRATQSGLSGGELRSAWRSVGWVVLADKRRAHRPHPERPGHVLCGRRLDPSISIQRKEPYPLPCKRCVDVLRRKQENLGLRTIVVASSSRDASSSVRTVRGGLPTLGRNR